MGTISIVELAQHCHRRHDHGGGAANAAMTILSIISSSVMTWWAPAGRRRIDALDPEEVFLKVIVSTADGIVHAQLLFRQGWRRLGECRTLCAADFDPPMFLPVWLCKADDDHRDAKRSFVRSPLGRPLGAISNFESN